MRFFCFFFVLIAVVSCKRKSDYENKVDKFRSQTIGFYVSPDESPLDSTELKTFKGIHYYPINESYKVEAKIVWLPQTTYIQMKHSGGDTRPYMKTAELHFALEGKSLVLPAYQTEELRMKHLFFVPFTDQTCGKETYSGGRYLDLSYDPASSDLLLDFNFAYAPFCAYTHHYSCPVVPAENYLDAAIKAGERQ